MLQRLTSAPVDDTPRPDPGAAVAPLTRPTWTLNVACQTITLPIAELLGTAAPADTPA